MITMTFSHRNTRGRMCTELFDEGRMECTIWCSRHAYQLKILRIPSKHILTLFVTDIPLAVYPREERVRYIYDGIAQSPRITSKNDVHKRNLLAMAAFAAPIIADDTFFTAR